MDHNGGSVVAMVGKECVAIASDLRLGNQAMGISSHFQKVLVECVFLATGSLEYA
jgi:20S proteasome subunit beta 3